MPAALSTLLLLLVPLAVAADDLADLTVEALSANPGIAAMEARVEQLDALAGVADAWPDPMAMLEYSNVPVSSWGLADHPMAGLQLKAQQTIPFPGVTGLRQEVAESRVAVAEASLDEARLRLVRAVEESWWRLLLVRQLRAVTAEHVELTDQLVEAVRARYETGSAGQHALVRLQVLRDKLADDLDDFERRDRQLSAALVASLARSPADRFDTPAEAVPLAPGEGVAGWLDQAREERPALEELRAAERGAELEARLARADARPDLTVWGGYRVRTVQTDVDPGTDLASLGISAPITLSSSRVGRGKQSAALEAAAAARRRHEALLDSIEAQLESAHAAWTRAASKAQVYQDELLPAARQALDTTLADYRVDKADFASLYQAEVQLLELDRARLTAITETHLQNAAVRAITGQSSVAGDQR